MKNNLFQWTAAVLISLLICGPAFADYEMMDAIEEFGEQRYVEPLPDRLKAGPLRIHPTLRTRMDYDDNILRQSEPEDPRDDVIWSIMPGAIMNLPVGPHAFSMGYEADIEVFTKNSRQNDQNQNFFALADLHFPSFYVNVLEKFKETSSRAGTTFEDRIPRYDQSINPKIGYKWKRATFEAGFHHFVRDYRRQVNDPFDFQSTEWTGVIYYDLFARLKALMEYQYGQLDYDDDYTRGANIHQTRVGLQGEIIPNMTVKVRTGAQFRDYTYKPENDFNSWVTDFQIEYQIRDNLKFSAGFSRDAVEATFDAVNFYRAHTGTLGVEYEVLPSWVLFTDFLYGRHDYAEVVTVDNRTGHRRDHKAVVKTGVRYELRQWWQFELAYNFIRRNSNFSSYDFTENLVSLESRIKY